MIHYHPQCHSFSSSFIYFHNFHQISSTFVHCYPIKFTFNHFHPFLPPSFTFAQSYLLSPLSSISIHFRWISKFLVRVTSVKVFSRYPHSLGPHQNKSQSVNESVTRITSRAAYAAKKYKTLETYLFCSVNLPIQYLKLSLNWVPWIFALLHIIDCFHKGELDISPIKPKIEPNNEYPELLSLTHLTEIFRFRLIQAVKK